MPIRRPQIIAPILIAVAVAGPSGVTAASAGTYDVRSCSPNPVASPPPRSEGVDSAWVFETNDATHLQSLRQCPPAEDSGIDGLVVRAKLNSGSIPVGGFAHWRFDAPVGTKVARLRLWRYAGKAASTWALYTRTADGTALADSDCFLDPTSLTCELGGPGVLADWTVDTPSLFVGFSCSNATTSCATGATLHEVWTGIYSAIVTVNDPTPPTASGATGTIFADGYVRGTVTAGVTQADDSTGIRALQVRVDGDRVVGTSPDRGSCDFTRRAPCQPLTSGESFSFDSRNIGDGTYTARVGALDAAQNFTAAGSRLITVDNTAPSAPTPTSPTSSTTGATSAVLTWEDPVGQTAPITRAHVTLCGPAACGTTTEADSGTATVGLSQGPGTYTASVALEDAAGNFAPGNATTWTIAVAPAPAGPLPTQPAPGPAPQTTAATTPARKTSARLTAARPTVARDRRTITVTGAVAPTATGRVTVTAKARIRGRTMTVTRRATIRSHRYSARLRLPSAAWRTATVTVRFAGDARHDAARLTRRVAQRPR